MRFALPLLALAVALVPSVAQQPSQGYLNFIKQSAANASSSSSELTPMKS